MGRPPLEVADVISEHQAAFFRARQGRVSEAQRRVMDDLVRCRTAAMGGHVLSCGRCGHESIEYNSCRNRHCPKCQARARAQWFEDREREVLPVEYFHVVFTVPREVAAIALQNKRIVYEILFRRSAAALIKLGRDEKRLGAELGVLSVLHTWGQNLEHHPHVHCVVSGGGPSPDGTRWIRCRPGFLFPVRVLGRLFRGAFLSDLKDAFARGRLTFHGSIAGLADAEQFRLYLQPLYDVDWVVYSKAPFGGPDRVLKYLARYTHRVAISNRRLVGMSDGKVSFIWKDYAAGEKRKVMTLDAVEFLRRFLLHIVPKGFRRIRHYGFLANRNRAKKLERCRELLGVREEPRTEAADGTEQGLASSSLGTDRCPKCGEQGLSYRELAPVPRSVVGRVACVASSDTS